MKEQTGRQLAMYIHIIHLEYLEYTSIIIIILRDVEAVGTNYRNKLQYNV